jgi:hypothetical protein
LTEDENHYLSDKDLIKQDFGASHLFNSHY